MGRLNMVEGNIRPGLSFLNLLLRLLSFSPPSSPFYLGFSSSGQSNTESFPLSHTITKSIHLDPSSLLPPHSANRHSPLKSRALDRSSASKMLSNTTLGLRGLQVHHLSNS